MVRRRGDSRNNRSQDHSRGGSGSVGGGSSDVGRGSRHILWREGLDTKLSLVGVVQDLFTWRLGSRLRLRVLVELMIYCSIAFVVLCCAFGFDAR